MADIERPDLSIKWAQEGQVLAPTEEKVKLGWTEEVPPLQWFNWIHNTHDTNFEYLMQKGVPEWSDKTEYQADKSFVQYEGVLYKCIQSNTNQQPDTQDAYWRVASLGLDNLSDIAGTGLSENNGVLDVQYGTSSSTATRGDDIRVNNGQTAYNWGNHASENYLKSSNNLSDLGDYSTARSNLGLGDSATLNVGAVSGTVAAGNDPRITGAVLRQELASTDDPSKGAGMVGYSPLEEYEEDTIGGGLQSVKKVGSTYRDKNDLKDLGINGTLLEGGGFPRSMSDELSDNYSGNNPGLTLINQAPVDLAQCSFIPPNEISSHFVHSNFPYMSVGGSMKRLMAVDIRTNLFNSPVNIPIFKPTRTNGSGILSFRYIGDKPLHTVIQGNLLFLLRTGATSKSPFSRVILRLESSGHPHLEEGENPGVRSLGVSLGGFREPFFIENYEEYQDLCFPIDQAALDNVASQPNLYVGSDNGFFASNYAPDTEQLATADGNGPVGPEVRTTKWMDVESYVQSQRRFLMNFTGTSTVSRVQYKDADGNIKIYTNMNIDGSSRRIYRLPPDAKYARIYYSGRDDTVDESSIEFKPLGALTSTEYDPLAGLWTERHISVHRDIVLWPGVEYWFNLYTQAYEGASARSWGFRVQSGGLSFLFDSGGIRKNIASTFWEK